MVYNIILLLYNTYHNIIMVFVLCFKHIFYFNSFFYEFLIIICNIIYITDNNQLVFENYDGIEILLAKKLENHFCS